MTQRYALHGLVVASDIPLPQAQPALAGAIDLTITLGDRVPRTRETPQGEVLVRRIESPDRGYEMTRLPDGSHHLRFRDTLDAVLDDGARHVQVRLHDGVEADVAGVLAGGFLLATALLLRGHLVLHGTAVEFAGRGLAIVGQSGQGKSTIATLLVAAGAAMVTEDVLRVGTDSDDPTCFPGTTEVRLRPKAASLADRLASHDARMTVDGRLALALPPSAAAVVPLSQIVLPRPQLGAAEVGVVAVTGTAALAALLRCPRIPGWFGPPVPAEQLRLIADLVRRVPVWSLTVPWGPPFAADLGERILTALDAARGVTPAPHSEPLARHA